ncbi:hypothetical protein JCM3774_000159 [Rhodotorula dairenensis]
MSSKDVSTPLVEPIQKPANVPTPGGNSAPPATTSRSDNASDTKQINPSPVVDEGPAGGADIPSHQVRSSGADRPGTQDALRGQGNSATVSTFSREDYAPVSRNQRADDSEYKKAQDEGRMSEAGGESDFRQTDAHSSNEPAPGKPKADRESDKNLVEAGTTMSGAGGADSGSPAEQHKQGSDNSDEHSVDGGEKEEKSRPPLNDLEAQAAKNRSQRHKLTAPRLSPRRMLYIGGTFLLCLVIIAIGTVNGIHLSALHKAASEAQEEANPVRLEVGDDVAKMEANAKLLVAANVIQGDLQRIRPFEEDDDD